VRGVGSMKRIKSIESWPEVDAIVSNVTGGPVGVGVIVDVGGGLKKHRA
jgi:hypothetical protein